MVTIIKNMDEFDKKLNNGGDTLLVLDFYATWCGPCKEMDPHVKKLVKDYKDKVNVLKINVDKFPDICDYYKVKSMPTFVFIRNKKRLSSFAGADEKLLKDKMKSLVK